MDLIFDQLGVMLQRRAQSGFGKRQPDIVLQDAIGLLGPDRNLCA
jgi:hypothetical protein